MKYPIKGSRYHHNYKSSRDDSEFAWFTLLGYYRPIDGGYDERIKILPKLRDVPLVPVDVAYCLDAGTGLIYTTNLHDLVDTKTTYIERIEDIILSKLLKDGS
jgi:hypothetical protein